MTNEPSRELVLKKLHDCFPDAQLAISALAILDRYGTKEWHNERDRVQLAILMQARGDLALLGSLVEVADLDFRDILLGAEYPEESRFPLETPDEELQDVRQRDRAQYEAWLQSGGAKGC
jgi:hypothetical protein